MFITDVGYDLVYIVRWAAITRGMYPILAQDSAVGKSHLVVVAVQGAPSGFSLVFSL